MRVGEKREREGEGEKEREGEREEGATSLPHYALFNGTHTGLTMRVNRVNRREEREKACFSPSLSLLHSQRLFPFSDVPLSDHSSAHSSSVILTCFLRRFSFPESLCHF